jgi:universal stress protein A
MATLKRLLAPTDFSDLSVRGVRYACQLAKDVGADVIVINVVTVDESNAIDEQEIARHKTHLNEFVTDMLAGTATDLQIRQIVVGGQPFGAIVDCAEKEGVDLIVMSSHGRSGLSRMLIGSVTDKILRGGFCPVLVVPLAKEN